MGVIDTQALTERIQAIALPGLHRTGHHQRIEYRGVVGNLPVLRA